jgi:small-conductance mechanosensitive channel
MKSLTNFLDFDLITIGDNKIKVYTLLAILIIYISTRLILWLIKKALFRKQESAKIDIGNTYALFQIIKYIIWIVALSLMLQSVGIQLTVLLAGSAALLVGIGLGLQQTFNDILSGIILLSERSIKVDDILEIDGDIIKIRNIGLRTSEGLNRDEISVIVPNSLITTNKVINWSHQSKKARFKINVGVAYGSDVELVLNLLKESAAEHPDVINDSALNARLIDFGNSSIDFQLLFYSKNIFRIENVKSDIRRTINRKFLEHNINIPFPQMDVHLQTEKE